MSMIQIEQAELDTNVQHLHSETEILSIKNSLKLDISRLRQPSQHPQHSLHGLALRTINHKHEKQCIYDNKNNYTANHDTNVIDTTEQSIKQNMKLIQPSILTE